MGSDVGALILIGVFIVAIFSVIGYCLARTEPDPDKPEGNLFGNALWYIKLGRRRKGNEEGEK